jgi:DNA-binding NarL/FixJ family response regulator
MIAILLVEDHAILSKSISALVDNPDMAVVAVARTGEETLALLPELNVDLALIDVSLPGINGIELVVQLRREYPDLPCIVLSGHHETVYVRRAMAVGARGYVTKGDPPALLEGIRRVMAGEIYLSDSLAGNLNDKGDTGYEIRDTR